MTTSTTSSPIATYSVVLINDNGTYAIIFSGLTDTEARTQYNALSTTGADIFVVTDETAIAFQEA